MIPRTALGLILVVSAFGASEVPGDWPRWRGPFNTGMARGDAPLKWSDTENIAWKVAIPGKGHSSPVIWGDRLFLTTAVPTQPEAAAPPEPQGGAGAGRRGGFGQGAAVEQPEHKLTVMCLDRKTGKVIWEKVAKTVKPHEGYHRRYGSFASNSPVTDGKRLYTFFGSNGAYAYDLDGKPIWSWDPEVKMRMRMAFGEGVPLTLYDDAVLLNFDHQGDSFLAALDKNTGKVLWKVPRQEESNWSPPFVVEHGGRKQVIVAAANKVRAYDLEDGKPIWECAGLGANVIPAPVYVDGIVIVMSGYRNPNLLAIRLGKEGDLTGTDAIVWSTQRGLSYTGSPVLHEGKLYVQTDSGMLSVFDAKTGKPFYEQVRLPKPYNFKASPVGINGKLYLSSENGDAIVVRMGEKFEVLATNTLADQSFIATPAVSAGDLYLRSETHLFCIREKR